MADPKSRQSAIDIISSDPDATRLYAYFTALEMADSALSAARHDPRSESRRTLGTDVPLMGGFFPPR